LKRVVGNVERKIGRVVKNVQRRLRQVLRRGHRKRSMKAGMGPPYGGGKIQKWLERIIVGGAGLRRKFSRKKDRTGHQKRRSKNTFNEGWNGSSSLRVVGNIPKRLEQSSSGGERVVVGNVPRKHSKKAETSRNGSTESFNEGWNGSSDWVVKNVQRLLEQMQAIDDVQERLTRRGFVGTNNLSLETVVGNCLLMKKGPGYRNGLSETIKEVWNGSLEQVLVVNVRRSLEQADDDHVQEMLGHVRNGYYG
jgi:hypothetical protein